MKHLIKKILKEEFEDDFGWAQDNYISGEELRELLLQTKVNTIPFEIVEGYLDLDGTQVRDLGQLQSVGSSLNLFGTQVRDLGQLKSVGGFLDLGGTQVRDLGQLQSVGGDLDLRDSKIESLGQLRSVGGDLDLRDTKIESLGQLQSVGGSLILFGAALAEVYSEEEIRSMVEVRRNIYL
jgi:hypothetical protein